mmetsp:Transcript_1937/g.5058  ORF Transcript_1937/g.5058 Transcript_1937/m.5058 type:complete len:323 (+) Transcript_1937:43-1011(+)
MFNLRRHSGLPTRLTPPPGALCPARSEQLGPPLGSAEARLPRRLGRRLRRLLARLEHVGEVELAGAVAAAHHRPARHVQEAELLRDALVALERLGRDVLRHGHVALGGPHVLSQRDHVHARLAQHLERVHHLLRRLPAPQHDGGLGHRGARLLGQPQHLQRLAPARAPVAHKWRGALHRLHVVRKHVQAAAGHELDVLARALEVRHERLHQQLAVRLLLQLPHRLGNVVAALVGKVVAVDAGEHNVVQAPVRDRLGHVLRLLRIQRRRRTRGLHRAEAAAACAGVAHEHHSRRGGVPVAAAPTLPNVGALGLLAHGVQLELP